MTADVKAHLSAPRALLIAYYFPPSGLVGTVRVAKFAKYLKRLGWHTRVISVFTKYYQTINPHSIMDVAGIPVSRTKRVPQLIRLVNEEGLYWLPHLTARLVSVLRHWRPHIVLFTGGPFAHWLLTPFIRRLYGIPYILDFRDPWRLDPYRRDKGMFSYLYRLMASVIEPIAIDNASYIVNVTEQATEMFKKKYPRFRQKFLTLHNGFDPEDLGGERPSVSFSRCDIAYVGAFGEFRNPEPFFLAFRKLILEKALKPDEIHFVWVGKHEDGPLETISRLGIRDYCALVGYKPYLEALSYIRGSKACLLVSGNHPYEPTTKVFDYIALDKWIIALLGSDGFLSSLLDKYESVIKVLNPDPEKAYGALKAFFEMSHRGEKQATEPNIKQEFNRQIITSMLSQVLEKAIDEFK
jgi:glycosyltransferase involved in cell wall biosynthesis